MSPMFPFPAPNIGSIAILQPGHAHYRDDLFQLLAERTEFVVLYTTSAATYPGGVRPSNYRYEFVESAFLPKWLKMLYTLIRMRPRLVVSSRAGYMETVVARIYRVLSGSRHVLWILEWRDPESEGSFIRRSLRKRRAQFGRMMIRTSDAIIAMGTQAEVYALRAGQTKAAVFRTINCSRDTGGSVARKPRSRDHKFTYLYLGRMLDWKGADVLIRAFAQLEPSVPNVRLIVAGDGPFYPTCVQLATDLGIHNIQFLGSVDPAEVHNVYAEGDVFVLPSCVRHNAYEAWGLVLNEAMSAGLPVIATDAVGAAYDLIVPGCNGYMVRNGHVESLLQAMRMVLNSDVNEMGKHSRRIFEEVNSFQAVADVFSSAFAYANGINQPGFPTGPESSA